MDELDDNSDFNAFLGGWGTHANTAKRAKAERMATLKKSDGRRNPKRVVTRPHQFNVRIDDDTLNLVKALAARQDASHADIVIKAIAAYAKSEEVTA